MNKHEHRAIHEHRPTKDAKSTFWVLNPPRAESRLAVWAKGEVDVLAKNCPVNPAHDRAGGRTPVLSVILPNPPVQQLVWTWHSELLIQDSAAIALRNASLNKFELRKAETRYRDYSQKPPDFWEFLARGWGGMARPESGIRLLEHCEHCGRTVYSALTNPDELIDPLQWDRSDIFIVWPPVAFIFVTDRVRQFFIANSFRDVTFTPVANLKMSDMGVSTSNMPDFVRDKVGYPWSTSESN